MNYFQPVHLTLAFLGPTPLKPFQKYHSIRGYFRSIFFTLTGLAWLISLIVFMSREAVTFQDYTDALYFLLCVVMFHAINLILCVYAQDLFQLMEEFEDVIRTRKSEL